LNRSKEAIQVPSTPSTPAAVKGKTPMSAPSDKGKAQQEALVEDVEGTPLKKRRRSEVATEMVPSIKRPKFRVEGAHPIGSPLTLPHVHSQEELFETVLEEQRSSSFTRVYRLDNFLDQPKSKRESVSVANVKGWACEKDLERLRSAPESIFPQACEALFQVLCSSNTSPF
jgi:hypothetical protein